MTAITPATATAGPAAAPVDPRLAQAADAFEAIFLRQMIGAMRSANLTDDAFAGGSSGQFRDMADAHVADSMAGSGKLGIAEALLAGLSRR